jgi:ribosomal protein S18 acetylase RimI-like enzyme
MIEIRKLDQSYRGYPLEFSYRTDSYYEIAVEERGEDYIIQMELAPLLEPLEKHFTDQLMEDWLDHPIVYGAFVDQNLAGVLELNFESWNQRLRIANILIFEPYRRLHLGIALMREAIREGTLMGARALILETQSCNVPAIRFYRQCGFTLAGFDLSCYGDYDVEKKEVRIEMTRKLNGVTVDYQDVPLQRLVKDSMIRKTLEDKLKKIEESILDQLLNSPKSLRQIRELYGDEPFGNEICNRIAIEFEKEDLRRPILFEQAFPKINKSNWKMNALEISFMKVDVTFFKEHFANIQSLRHCDGTAGHDFGVWIEFDQAVLEKDLKRSRFIFEPTISNQEWIVAFDTKDELQYFLKELFLNGTIEIL